MARGNIAKISASEDFNSLAVQFADESTVSADVTQLPSPIIHRLANFGLQVKLRNTYAGETSLEVAKAKLAKALEQLIAGNWAVQREGGGGGNISDLAQALSQLTGMDIAACVDKLEDMEDAEKKALRKHELIAVELAKISLARKQAAAEKAGASETAGEDLLAGFSA